MLTRVVKRPVVDATEITGQYNISLKFSPEEATDSALPSVYTALREQLGLQLVPRKAQVKQLIIDRANRVPTEN